MRNVTVIKRYAAGEVNVVAVEEHYTGYVVSEDDKSLTLGSKYGTLTFAKNAHTEIVEVA